MRALLTILSLGTGVALLAAPARADIAPDPDSVHAHCTKVEQCADGVLCEYAWSPGGKPGESEKVGADCRMQAEAKGLDKIFSAAGFEWRGAGCSMCLAMNPDKLIGDQLCASSSNRNFKGRQGSPTGRTVLMSPVMVAAAAITGGSHMRPYM